MAEQIGGSDWETAIRRALKKLSARDVKAIEIGDDEIILAVSRDGALEPCGEVAEDVWSVIERRGWVGTEANGTWRLSNAGRIHLKRLLSRSGVETPNNDERPYRAGPGRPGVNVNLAESPLAWLRRRTDRNGKPLISQSQFEAGERLRSDFERGNMGPRVTANWSAAGGVSPGSAGPDREIELNAQAIAARERTRAALAAAGPELSGILIDVCCHLKGLADVERDAGWPQRTAKVVLLMALTTLARHYGLIGQEGEGRQCVRHWGAEDYRPVIGGEG